MLKLNYDPFKIAEAHLELWNNRNPVPMKELLAPTATFKLVSEPEAKPIAEAGQEFVTMFRTAFPDLHFTQTNIVPAPGILTIEWTVTATHKGPFMGMPATGRIATVPGATVYKINEDGKIYNQVVHLNRADILNAIGMLTPPLAEEQLREKALELLEAFNKRDIVKIQSMVLPATRLIINGVVELNPGPRLLRNLSAVPDLKWTVEQLTVRGNQVVAEIVSTGTFLAPLGTLAPTGRPVKWNACVILTFKGDKVEEFKGYLDEYSLLVQAGALPQVIAR